MEEYGPPPLFRQGLPARLRFILFLFASVLLILIDGRFRALDDFRSAISDVTAPMVRALEWPGEAVSSASEYFVSKARLRDENQRLTEENQRLSLAVAHLTEMQQENERLRRLVNAVPRTASQVVTAEVLGHMPDPFTRRLRINLGSDDGLLVGMPVIAADGVVGQVSRVVHKSAEVKLLTDHRQQLSVFVARTGEHYVLGGNGSDLTNLLFVLPGADLKEGDALLTSGLDHIFPRNILAGTVRSVSHEPGETYARVEVAMPDYDDAQFVTVILVDPNPTAELDASDKKDSSLRRRRER